MSLQVQRTLGQRVSQEISSVVTQYLLDTQPGLYKVLQADDGSTTQRYVHDQRGILSHQNGEGDWNWIAADGLGSVRGVYDDDLAQVYSVDFDPYGTVIGDPGSNPTNFGYPGEWTDQNGLVYLRARYYDPVLGSFFNLDPLETENRYGYVNANPTNLVDPSGQIYESPVGWDGCYGQSGSPCAQAMCSQYEGYSRCNDFYPNCRRYCEKHPYRTSEPDHFIDEYGHPDGTTRAGRHLTMIISKSLDQLPALEPLFGGSCETNTCHLSDLAENILAVFLETTAPQPKVKTRGELIGFDINFGLISGGLSAFRVYEGTNWDDRQNSRCRTFFGVEAGGGIGEPLQLPAGARIWSTADLDGLTGLSINLSGDAFLDWLLYSEQIGADIDVITDAVRLFGGVAGLSIGTDCNVTLFAGSPGTLPSGSLSAGLTSGSGISCEDIDSALDVLGL